MAAGDDVTGFVREALARGLPRAQIEAVLREAGWQPAQVKSALAHFANLEFPIPVPAPRSYVSARDAFVYLILFMTLYISAYNVGALLFRLIDMAVPDPAATAVFSQYVPAAIRRSIASLIVAFPIFLFVSWSVSRAVRLSPSRRASPVRRWLTYLTLFVAASVLIGDLIALLSGLLGGDVTIRFVLKVLTVGVIAGMIFGYYLWDLRSEDEEVAP
ncbi:MAG: DUF5671 domain-containing protein [Vicinamibacteraceae bacterium]